MAQHDGMTDTQDESRGTGGLPDVLSRPELRPYLTSGDALVLLSADLESALWSNRDGAELLGAASPSALVAEIPESGCELLGQAMPAARRALDDAEPASAVVRTRADLRTHLRTVEFVPCGGDVLLVTDGRSDETRATGDDALGALATDLADGAQETAVLDAEGRTISASAGLRDMELEDGAMADAFATGAETVAGSAGLHPVRFVSVGDEPARHLALVGREARPMPQAQERRWFYRSGRSEGDADDASTEAETTPSESEPEDTKRSVGFLGATAGGAAALGTVALGAAGLVRTVRHSDETAENATEAGSEEGVSADVEYRDDLLKLDGAADAPAALPEDDDFEGAALYAAPDGYEPSAGSEDPETVPASSPEGSGAFRFRPNERATRFVWSLDADHRFTGVSEPLAACVGPEFAELEGETWDAVTDRLGIDEDGSIADLIERGDTWSGRTVMWPVEGEDLRVPVDLAGLPAFDRDRNFTGFNGFGIVRTADAVPDGGAAESSVEGDESAPFASVVDLSARRNGGNLSPDEQDAFEEIGERLGGEVDNEEGEIEDEPLGAVEDGTEAVEYEAPEPAALISEIAEDEPEAEGTAEAGEPSSGVRVAEVRDVDTSILARLPIPVLAYRGDLLLFGNDEFFALTGYETIHDLARAGGVEALFGERRSEDDLEGASIVHRDGRRLAVDAHLQTVPWDDERAMLLTLKRDEGDGRDDTPDAPKKGPSDGGSKKGKTRSRLKAIWGTRGSGGSKSSDSDGPSATIAEADHPFAALSPTALLDMLDTATEGVMVLDADARVRAMNRPAEALFDVDSEDILGEPFVRLLAPECHRSALDYLAGLTGPGVASVLNDGREVIGRVGADTGGRSKDEDRGLVPLFLTIGRIHESGGDTEDPLFCAVVRDMTHWKKTEEDLVNARAEAERASSDKSDFLTSVSHEVRTPLNAIIGFSDLMIEERFGPVGNDRYRGYLRDIRTSGRHVLDLVNDLLDISKIEAGEMALDFDSVALNTVVTETVAMSQAQANKERIVIRTSLAVDLPPVVADPRSMRQIVLNLLSNALKYTQAGGQVIVSTAYQAGGDDAGEVVVRVRDTGVGMDAAELEQALKPFRQVTHAGVGHNAGERGGTGLGLPLTKALVEANRADFSISSTPQEGTLVEMRFPPQRVLTH